MKQLTIKKIAAIIEPYKLAKSTFIKELYRLYETLPQDQDRDLTEEEQLEFFNIFLEITSLPESELIKLEELNELKQIIASLMNEAKIEKMHLDAINKLFKHNVLLLTSKMMLVMCRVNNPTQLCECIISFDSCSFLPGIDQDDLATTKQNLVTAICERPPQGLWNFNETFNNFKHWKGSAKTAQQIIAVMCKQPEQGSTLYNEICKFHYLNYKDKISSNELEQIETAMCEQPEHAQNFSKAVNKLLSWEPTKNSKAPLHQKILTTICRQPLHALIFVNIIKFLDSKQILDETLFNKMNTLVLENTIYASFAAICIKILYRAKLLTRKNIDTILQDPIEALLKIVKITHLFNTYDESDYETFKISLENKFRYGFNELSKIYSIDIANEAVPYNPQDPIKLRRLSSDQEQVILFDFITINKLCRFFGEARRTKQECNLSALAIETLARITFFAAPDACNTATLSDNKVVSNIIQKHLSK